MFAKYGLAERGLCSVSLHWKEADPADADLLCAPVRWLARSVMCVCISPFADELKRSAQMDGGGSDAWSDVRPFPWVNVLAGSFRVVKDNAQRVAMSGN